MLRFADTSRSILLALVAPIVMGMASAACGDDATTGAASGGGDSIGATSSGGGGGEPVTGGAVTTTTGSSAGAATGSPTSGSTGAGGGAGGAAGSGGSGGDTPEVDECETRVAVCTDVAPRDSGQGLVALDRCGFALERGAAWDTLPTLVDALETVATPVDLSAVLDDLNREPVPVTPTAVPGDPPGVEYAFRWEDEENDKPTWVPQGLTGSADADPTGLVLGRRLLMVSFYFDEEEAPTADPKGVRIALVDVTDTTAPKYRFLLLVEPTAGPDFVPVKIHAGGIAWVGDLLYVADTSKGLRVFDVSRLLQVDTSEDVIGCDGGLCRAGLYKYVIPQIGAYTRSSPCVEAPRFSFVGLDRSSDPIQLVSGEYCSGTACTASLAGRVFRWPLDPRTHLLAGGARTWSADAHLMGERQVQGGVSNGEAFYLSSSEPAGSGGVMYRVTVAGRTAVDWIDTPEDVVIDTVEHRILSLSEGLGARYVMSADLGAYQP